MLRPYFFRATNFASGVGVATPDKKISADDAAGH
jgi:hypothetical protein